MIPRAFAAVERQQAFLDLVARRQHYRTAKVGRASQERRLQSLAVQAPLEAHCAFLLFGVSSRFRRMLRLQRRTAVRRLTAPCEVADSFDMPGPMRLMSTNNSDPCYVFPSAGPKTWRVWRTGEKPCLSKPYPPFAPRVPPGTKAASSARSGHFFPSMSGPSASGWKWPTTSAISRCSTWPSTANSKAAIWFA